MNLQRCAGRIAVRAVLPLLLAVLQAGAVWAWTGRVVGVADGDTLTVLRNGRDQVKIRLYGIDAPESGQPFGKASKRNLSSLVHGKPVRVDVMDTDRYGRAVARLFVDGTDVSAEQLRSGHAWLYAQYCKDLVCDEWRGLEARARSSGRGLWADRNPAPPWQWRREERGAATSWVETFLRKALRLFF